MAKHDPMNRVITALDSLTDAQNQLLHVREDSESARAQTVLDESVLAINKVREHLIAHLAPYGVTKGKWESDVPF